MSLIILFALAVQVLVLALIGFILIERRKLRQELDSKLEWMSKDEPDYLKWLWLYKKWGLEPPSPFGKREAVPR